MKSKASYLWLVLFALIVVFFFYAQNKVASKRSLILLKGEKAIGTIYDVAGEHLKCKYEINGVSYVFGREVPYQYLEDGEQFEIKFLSEYPEYIVIEFDKPVFSSDFIFLEVPPKQIEKMGSKLRFEYTVNDQHHIRHQFSQGDQSPSIQDYMVRYRNDNPQIGYLIKVK